MFEEENALPRSELHLSIDNRHCLAGARQNHADVRWHVVAPLGAVREIISIFRNQPIEELFQIMARARIGVLHHNDTTTGVLNENRNCPISDTAPVDLRLNVIGDFVKAFAAGAKVELVVMDAHG